MIAGALIFTVGFIVGVVAMAWGISLTPLGKAYYAQMRADESTDTTDEPDNQPMIH